MVTLLQSRGKMKISELTEELEVGERQIRTYRNDLEMGGIFITQSSGKYGGYKLENSHLNFIDLTNNEIYALNNIKEQLKRDKYMYSSEFDGIYHKINGFYKQNNQTDGYVNYFTIEHKANANEEDIKQKYYDINVAIVTRKKLKIEYNSLSSGISERIVRPYSIYNYKGDLYFLGFCEKRKDILDFKICRIVSIMVTEDNFNIPENFSLEDYYSNCIGIYKEGEVQIKLKIKYPYSIIISERIWVENQSIKEIEDKAIIFEATMRGYTEIKSWILSMGRFVEVIAPDRLIDDIRKEIEELKNIYNF